MTSVAPSTPRSVFAMRDQVEILLVDDRPENLLALEAILEPLGQKLIKAHSGEEALRMLLRHEVAVVLLDVYSSLVPAAIHDILDLGEARGDGAARSDAPHRGPTRDPRRRDV